MCIKNLWDATGKFQVIIVDVKSEPREKLINRISGLHLLISSIQDSASRKRVESLDSANILKALPGKLDIKRHSLSILYLSVTSLII